MKRNQKRLSNKKPSKAEMKEINRIAELMMEQDGIDINDNKMLNDLFLRQALLNALLEQGLLNEEECVRLGF
jgi:hypothetical protein